MRIKIKREEEGESTTSLRNNSNTSIKAVDTARRLIQHMRAANTFVDTFFLLAATAELVVLVFMVLLPNVLFVEEGGGGKKLLNEDEYGAASKGVLLLLGTGLGEQEDG